LLQDPGTPPIIEKPPATAQDGRAFDANSKPIPLAGEHKQAEIQDATTAEEMWRAIGEDCWVIVSIDSSARIGHKMEGTRLNVVSSHSLHIQC